MRERLARSRFWLFIVTAVLVVLIDQLTKQWAIASLKDSDPRVLLGGFLRLDFVLNPGAALGTGATLTVLLTVVALAVSAALVVVGTRVADTFWAIALGLFLGGSVGNLIDRLVRAPGIGRGKVVDFIGYGNLFVGNVADIALTVAAVLVIIRTVQGVSLDGTR